MFFSPDILVKKGALSKIWQAAHWQKSHANKKNEVMSLNIADACRDIRENEVPLALRTSAKLLSGVARIHQIKVTYLAQDCSDALIKIKMAFRPGVINLSMQETAATPAKINAPSISANDEELQSPRTIGKNKFASMDPKLNVDEWTNLTPVHSRTGKRSLTRQTPTYDDSDARSTTTMDDKEEQWSEFPFASEEASSVELVRKADDSRSDIVSEQQASNGGYQPYNYEDVDAIGDDEFRPSTGGAGDDTHYGGSGLDEGLMLSMHNQSWVDDAAMRENEENENVLDQKEKTASAKKMKKEKRQQAPGSASKRRKKSSAVTELSNEQIQQALGNVEDIVDKRQSLSERGIHEDELRARGFPVAFSRVTFDEGMATPSTQGLHPKLVQLFKQNAKPVPSFAGEKEAKMDGEEEDVEVARAATFTTGTDDMGGPTGPDDMPAYEYEDVNAMGDDSFRPSNAADQTDLSASRLDDAPDELELTFQESPSRSGRASGATPTSARRSTASSSQAVGDAEKWNPQTIRVMKLLRDRLSEKPKITYDELATSDLHRNIVAKAFYEILTLATRDMIAVSQKKPFGEINIVPGTKYDTLLPGE